VTEEDRDDLFLHRLTTRLLPVPVSMLPGLEFETAGRSRLIRLLGPDEPADAESEGA
jgi:hypothetical protein